MVLREHLPLRSTGGPGLLTYVPWRLKRGLWLTMILASPTETSQLGEGNGVGGMKEGGCVGVQRPSLGQPGWLGRAFGRLGSDRALIILEEHSFGRLGSDRALI